MMKVLYKAFLVEILAVHKEGKTQKARLRVLLSKEEQDAATYQMGWTS